MECVRCGARSGTVPICDSDEIFEANPGDAVYLLQVDMVHCDRQVCRRGNTQAHCQGLLDPVLQIIDTNIQEKDSICTSGHGFYACCAACGGRQTSAQL